MEKTLKEFLRTVAEFAEETYREVDHAVVVIHHGPGVSNTLLVALPAELRPEAVPAVVR